VTHQDFSFIPGYPVKIVDGKIQVALSSMSNYDEQKP